LNYLPFSGNWFFGASDAEEMAAYYSSWGLLGDAPAPVVPTGFGVRILVKEQLNIIDAEVRTRHDHYC